MRLGGPAAMVTLWRFLAPAERRLRPVTLSALHAAHAAARGGGGAAAAASLVSVALCQLPARLAAQAALDDARLAGRPRLRQVLAAPLGRGRSTAAAVAADVAALARHVGTAAPDGDHDDHTDSDGGGDGDAGGWRGPSMHPRHIDEALACLLRGMDALNEAAAAARQATAAAVPAYFGARGAAMPGDRAALDGLLDDAHRTLVGLRRLTSQAARTAAAVEASNSSSDNDGSGVGVPASVDGRRCDSVVATGVDVGQLLADAAGNATALCVEKNGHAPEVWVTTHGGGGGGSNSGDSSIDKTPRPLPPGDGYAGLPVVAAALVPSDVHFAGVELVKNAAASLLRRYAADLPDVADRDGPAAAGIAVDVYAAADGRSAAVTVADGGEGLPPRLADADTCGGWVGSHFYVPPPPTAAVAGDSGRAVDGGAVAGDGRPTGYGYSRHFGAAFAGYGVGLSRVRQLALLGGGVAGVMPRPGTGAIAWWSMDLGGQVSDVGHLPEPAEYEGWRGW
ncbi:hypothetical protein MMPV_008820 [Pyropia vietnamensis]